MTSWPVVQISERALGQIKKGSLWIFSNELKTTMKELTPGLWVEFRCRAEFAGFGYVNPHSLITGRVVSRKEVADRKKLFFELISASLGRRGDLTGSYRGVFSESDGLPGLVIDIFESPKPGPGAKIVVAQSSTAGMDQAQPDWSEALIEIVNPAGFVVKSDSSIRNLEGLKPQIEVLRGSRESLQNGLVCEDDLIFAADFVTGQKTGFFIDQRENRRHLRKQVTGKKVLDLCCYSGGWGLTALKAGAEHATFVDQSALALDLVSKGLKLNGIDPGRASLVTSDVFDYLQNSAESFDVVICDPPAFVKSKKTLPQAEKAYLKLNMLALARLRSGGLLYSCSCSYHLSEEKFQEILIQALQKRERVGTVIYRGGQSLDHPWILNRPESKYLKCLAICVR